MNDTKNRVKIRSKAEDLNERAQDPLFILYLFFLQPNLEMLADINKQLTIHYTLLTAKIKASTMTLLETLLRH